MTFSLSPKVLKTVDMFFPVCKKHRVADAKMLEVRYIQHIITAPEIKIGNAIGGLPFA